MGGASHGGSDGDRGWTKTMSSENNSENNAAAVAIFPQGQPTAGEAVFFPWIQRELLAADSGYTEANAQVFRIPSIRQPVLRESWRGYRVRREAELGEIDCPFPREPDWDH